MSSLSFLDPIRDNILYIVLYLCTYLFFHFVLLSVRSWLELASDMETDSNVAISFVSTLCLFHVDDGFVRVYFQLQECG